MNCGKQMVPKKGPYMVKDLKEGQEHSSISHFTIFNDELYFIARSTDFNKLESMENRRDRRRAQFK